MIGIKRFFQALPAVALLTGNAALADFELVRDGKSDCVIVLPDNAIPAKKTAAVELQKYIARMSGAKLKIASPAETAQAQRKILIGQSDEIKKLIPGIDFKAMKSDRIIIKADGDTLIFTGSRPRGTLYAVYTFLEDTLGIRWWTSTEEFIPVQKTISIPALSINYAPVVSDFRTSFYKDVNENPVFAAKLKSDGLFQNIVNRPDLGGGPVAIPAPCHTFFMLLPPEKYFAIHPEWYSADKDGKRFYKDGQLCLTNKAMTEKMISVVDKLLRENKNADYIAICPQDTFGKCLCPECMAVETEEGSAAGPVLRFANRIGEAVAQKYPDVKILAFAYSYYQEPAQKTGCGKNVIIQFCASDFSMFHAANSNENKERINSFLNWRKLNPSTAFWIWDYNAVFKDYLQPFPNYKVVDENIKFYARNGAAGIMIQGDGYNTATDFVSMRAWIIAHLLWNPELNYDSLENEFITGYYGKAAPFILEYMRMNEKYAMDKNMKLTLGKKSMDFLPPEAISHGSELLAKAVDAVKDDPVKLARTEITRIPLLYALTLFAVDSKMSVSNCKGWNFRNNAEAIAELEKRFKENKIISVEFSNVKDSARLIQMLAAAEAKPENQNVRQSMKNKMTAYVPIVNDKEASDGLAFAIPGNTKEWYVQYQPPAGLSQSGLWHCYADIRCDAEADNGEAATVGIYDIQTKSGKTVSVSVKTIKGTKYKTIDLGIHELNPDKIFYAAPANRPLNQLKAVYVDRFFMVKENAKPSL